MASKKGFQTVDNNIEELNEQIRSHRKAIVRRICCVVGFLLIVFVVSELWLALRSFSSYSVTSTVERRDSEAVHFNSFGPYILKYSNDGATCMDGQNQMIWNQSYEMTTPTLSKSDDYLAIYDRGGHDIYLMTKESTVKHLETTRPIVSVSVANQGTVAVLTKEDTTTHINLYDKNANELVNGEFYQENGGFPVDVALSFDAKKMAVAMVDVSDGNLKTIITFYNFGSVGQNEINNNVGVFSYSDMFIPEIEYVSNNRMIAIGDNEVIIFEGEEKPTVSQEIYPETAPVSIFYNAKHVGIVYESETEEGLTRHISLYNGQGKSVMDAETTLLYNDIYFLENGEVCLTTEAACEIYTTHSIRKFSYSFDNEIYRILSQGSGAQYIFVFEDATQEVRLR